MTSSVPLPIQTLSLELQAQIIEELIPLLPDYQLMDLRTTTHMRFMKSLSKPRSLTIGGKGDLRALCEDVMNFEQIICCHTHSPGIRSSFYRNPREHVLFGDITTLTMPMPLISDHQTRNLCELAFQYMEVADLTLVVALDDGFFPSIFSSWGSSFLCCVKHLKFKFHGDHLDKDEHAAFGEFLERELVWASPIWLPALVLFANLDTLTMDTPGVLVGMPHSCHFNRHPPPSFSLAEEEIKLAALWSQGLGRLQKIILIYAYELSSGNFIDRDGKHGRYIVLSKEVGGWVNNSLSIMEL